MSDHELAAYLDALPKEPDDLAALLRAKGIKGYRRNPCTCPLTCLLRQEWPQTCPVVRHDWTWLAGTDKDAGRTITPPHLQAFIKRFDRGEYPSLVAE